MALPGGSGGNCSLVVLDADKFAELPKEYDWVSAAECGNISACWECANAYRIMHVHPVYNLDGSSTHLSICTHRCFLPPNIICMQAHKRLQDMGQHYAEVLDALPLLETLWKAAATFDPLKSPSALMLVSSDARTVQAQQQMEGRQALLRKRGLLEKASGWWPGKGGRKAGGDKEKSSGGKGRQDSNLARP
jgi:hypothetical protein